MKIAINIKDREIKNYLEEILSDFNIYFTEYNGVIINKFKSIDVVICDNIDDLEELALNNFKCLVLSKNPNFVEAHNFLNKGARGYANARMQKIHFVDAINCIKNGGVWLLPDIVANMVNLINQSYKQDNFAIFNVLDEREKIVANYIKDGLSNSSIAEMLNLSERTIKSISSSIYQKVGVKNRIQLVMALKNI
ncbi:response regulator transcription factor [Campylobacter sp. MG1]|uniref:response regulator transcription factor n=1 Tax=Campylobacter sp. MG1 TaxID=2976332 RepID=UPI00226CB0E2|nr:response regulator transcription factor [Campylobacter sp. MG1]